MPNVVWLVGGWPFQCCYFLLKQSGNTAQTEVEGGRTSHMLVYWQTMTLKNLYFKTDNYSSGKLNKQLPSLLYELKIMEQKIILL